MNLRKFLTTLFRIAVGVWFIASGLAKADDPLGFSYKLNEYFEVLGLKALFPDPAAVVIAIFISVFEAFIGFTLLIGVFVNFTALMLVLMIIYFSFLTFYSAAFNKVTDCGCFGDAMHFTPWQSFGKDIILLVLILFLAYHRKYIHSIIPARAGRALSFVALLICLLFSLYGYYYLPIIDFRPYKDGNDIQKLMELPPNAAKDSVVMTFTYKKGDQTKTLAMDHLSDVDSTWQFVSREDKVIRKGDVPKIHDFSISSQDSDITKVFLAEKGYRIVIIQYDLEKSNTQVQSALNRLYAKLMADAKMKWWALSGSSSALNDNYRKTYHVPYPFYSSDVTMLKTVIRSNPGLVLFHDNVVIHKWPSTALPDADAIYAYMK